MNLQTLNPWAILAATLSAFVIGGLWFSPLLFGAVWRKANGFGADEPKTSPVKVFGISLILSFVMAFNLAMFLNDPKTNLAWGATAGFLAGFGWVAMGVAMVALFERRPWTWIFVNGGYLTVALVAMGAILGGWR